MATVVLIIHIMLALGLIGVVLLQRSEGGALGMGGGGGGGFMSGRGAANFLTRVTAGLAAAFFATSLVLSIMAAQPGARPSLLDTPIPGAPPGTSRPTQAPPPAAPSGGLPQINLAPGGGSEGPKIPQSK